MCGLCAELCVAEIIKFDGDAPPNVPPEAERTCINCGQCVVFCPVSAVSLAAQPAAERVLVKPELMPALDSAETLLRSRRSVRRYVNEPLEEGTVRRLIETARFAPSAVNRQPVRWLVTSGREKNLALGQLVVDFFNAQSRQQSQEGGELQRAVYLTSRWKKGEDVIFRGAPQLAVAVIPKGYPFPEDGAMALTYFELAAHSLGIGCCWAGFFTIAARQSAEIQHFLGVNENEYVAGGQMFGRPDGLGLSRILPPRKTPDITLI